MTLGIVGGNNPPRSGITRGKDFATHGTPAMSDDPFSLLYACPVGLWPVAAILIAFVKLYRFPFTSPHACGLRVLPEVLGTCCALFTGVAVVCFLILFLAICYWKRGRLS